MANYLTTLYHSVQGTLQIRYARLALGFHRRADGMRRGGPVKWWSSVLAVNDMTYECDSKLGSPKVIDCTQVGSQLGAMSDSVQVGAGEVRFLSSSNTSKAYLAFTIPHG